MGWNGLDLINDFSAELGDKSTEFKNKVLRYINEGIRDIATSHTWPFLRKEGAVIFTANKKSHSLCLPTPIAPEVALASGGSLTLSSSYRVAITFYEEFSKAESIRGFSSDSVITTSGNLSLEVSAIPVALSSLVTARRVYISKDNGAFYLHSSINNNVDEALTITTNSSSQIIAPEESYIKEIDGELYIVGKRVLDGTTIQDINYKSSASVSSGNPSCWAPIDHESVQVYPKPTEDVEVSFNYFKVPARVFGTSDSVPEIPSWLYDDLRNYVLFRGYDYRDRSGKESKKLNYEAGLKTTISRKGKPVKSAGRVRSKTPDSDGNLI